MPRLHGLVGALLLLSAVVSLAAAPEAAELRGAPRPASPAVVRPPVEAGGCAPQCTAGNDATTGDPWVVCYSDPTRAWVSAANNGSYFPEAICRQLGYERWSGRWGGHCGTTCGYCVESTCSAPGPEVYDGERFVPNCGYQDSQPVLCSTVMWECQDCLALTRLTGDLSGCAGDTVQYILELVNRSGFERSFNLAYQGFDWPIEGPATVNALAAGGRIRLYVRHTIPADAIEFDADIGTVLATEVLPDGDNPSDNPAIYTTELVTTARTFFGNRWEDPPSGHARGGVYFESGEIWGVAGNNASPHSYYPDRMWRAETGPGGNWAQHSGDMALGWPAVGAPIGCFLPFLNASMTEIQCYSFPGDEWTLSAPPAGVPAGGLHRYDVACPENAPNSLEQSEPCFVTGGLDNDYVPRNTAYAWDVVGDTFTALPPFTTARYDHASFLSEVPVEPDKRGRIRGGATPTEVDTWLCIAGGYGPSGELLDSTQCYSFLDGAWHGENADAPPLPEPLAASADGVLQVDGVPVPLVVGGLAPSDGGPKARAPAENGVAYVGNAYAFFNGAWYVAPGVVTAFGDGEGYPAGNTLHLMSHWGPSDNQPRYETVTICGTEAFGIDLTIRKETDRDTVLAGGEVTYTVTVTNASSLRATNVVMQDPLPPELTWLDGDESQGDCDLDAGVATCEFGDLEPGATATAWGRMRVSGASAAVENTASVACDQPDRDPESNTATARVTVLRPDPVDLWVDHRPDGFTASNANGVLEPGETVLAAPTWRNAGDGTITFTGHADSFAGPAALGYFIGDNSADYGRVPAGAEANCDQATGDLYRLWVPVPLVRPAVHWDATLREMLGAGSDSEGLGAGAAGQGLAVAALQDWSVHIGQSFTDVPVGSTFYNYVEMLLHSGVTLGCGGAFYCPGQPVTRWMMAMFLARAMAGSDDAVPDTGTVPGWGDYSCTPGGPSLFIDVSNADVYCRHVHYIAAAGVTLGCGGPMYCPASLVTRDQMAMFVSRAMAGSDGNVPLAYDDGETGRAYDCNGSGILANGAGSHFADVSTAESYCRHANYIWARGVVDGCSLAPPLYCPTDNVTREQMAKFLVNGFGLGPVLP